VRCSDCPDTDCYGDHAYCAFNYMHQESTDGRLILDQQVREQVFYEMNPDKWWLYMQYVGDECSIISEFDACQKNALKKLEIDQS
jgi:hypothetical protein